MEPAQQQQQQQPELNLLSNFSQVDPRTGRTYYPEAGCEPLDVSLLAGEKKTDLSVFFGRDHDFLITGLSGTQSGDYSVQFIRPDGRQLSTSQINNKNIVGQAQFPKPIWPPIRVPANGKIGVNITDLSNAANTVQIVFDGIRMYPTAR